MPSAGANIKNILIVQILCAGRVNFFGFSLPDNFDGSSRATPFWRFSMIFRPLCHIYLLSTR
jgi:hypothetical protein